MDVGREKRLVEFHDLFCLHWIDLAIVPDSWGDGASFSFKTLLPASASIVKAITSPQTRGGYLKKN